MNLRTDLESAPDSPESFEATEGSYTDGIKSLAKHFLRALDEWEDFDRNKDWHESDLGTELFERSKDSIPESLKEELTGAQVGYAAHLPYQAFIQ